MVYRCEECEYTMCQTCHFKLLHKDQKGTCEEVATFITQTFDLIAMPLTEGERLPVDLFEIKSLIQQRLPENISSTKDNHEVHYLNFYLRHITALANGRYKH